MRWAPGHTDKVLWTKDVQPDADRGEVDPAGTKLFVPGGEKFTGPNDTAEFLLDPKTGNVIKTFNITPASHDTTIGVSGKYAYMETKSSPIVSMVDIATNTIIKDLRFGNVVGPLVINSSDTLLLGNVMQYFGFEVMDVATGKVIAQVHADGVTETPNENPIALKNHGIAWKPDETEVWLGSKFHPDVFVYDMTVMPPKQTRRFNPGNGYNTVHWITFSIKGDFGYPSPDQNTSIRVQVIDTKTYMPVASMPNSESIMEVDFSGGKVVAVGSQYGIGRKAAVP